MFTLMTPNAKAINVAIEIAVRAIFWWLMCFSLK
jgi:hypothetical protein